MSGPDRDLTTLDAGDYAGICDQMRKSLADFGGYYTMRDLGDMLEHFVKGMQMLLTITEDKLRKLEPPE